MNYSLENEKIPVIAVVGPTASGKTALAIELAKHYNGEIISCDSMQIYKDLNIGTAKPTPYEQSQVRHHLVGFVDIDRNFSVSDYVTCANKAIDEIVSRGKLPILCGGTGLYARSLLYGIPVTDDSRDETVRMSLTIEFEKNGIEPLYKRLNEIDPLAAKTIHPNNTKRVIRALEFCLTTGRLFSSQIEKTKQIESRFKFVMLCLSFRDRAKLYERINIRVDKMLEEGLLEEARNFYNKLNGNENYTVSQSIGYKELFPYFRNEITLQRAIDNIKQSTRRYSKRQLTWFKKEKNIDFLYIDDFENYEDLFFECKKIVNKKLLKVVDAFE